MYFTISSGGTCRFKYRAVSVMGSILSRILETEHGILVIIGEGLSVSAPAHGRAQTLLRRLLTHEILQFVDKAAFSCGMRCTLVQDAAYMAGQRNIIQQMAQENPLAFIERCLRKRQSIFGELQVAALQF